ncbi:MAG: dTMP kinase [Acidimicrobiales bacterium]
MTGADPFSAPGRPELIAIEGIDRAGKTTQTELLRRALEAAGHAVEMLSFPRYDAFFGRTIRGLLDGLGPTSAATVDPRSMALWYALDRFDAFRERQAPGSVRPPPAGVVLVNRFTLSNAVYQSARVEDADPAEADAVFDWVLELEHGHLGLPRPALTVVLDVDIELSHERSHRVADAGGRAEEPDLYERSKVLLARARQRYLDAAHKVADLVVIPAQVADQTPGSRSAAHIHADVMTAVTARLPWLGA